MVSLRYACLVITGLLLFCSAPLQLNKTLDYKNVDLSYDRSNYGRSPLPFWFHLTEPELEVLQNIEKVKNGDPHQLLSLALIASGDVREADAFAKYHERVTRFVETVRPDVEKEDDFWKRGNLLYQRMRKEFLTADSSGELAGYAFGQSQLSVLFEKGTYNCISSAMLYAILGRWFDMRIEGVITRGHAFLQITAPDGKKLELETTAWNGFDLIHNEDFYRQQSSGWFKKRGIADHTYDDYLVRKVVEPYLLIGHNMKNQHTDFSRMAVEDVHRLIEYRAYIDDTNVPNQIDLINTYRIELRDLEEKNAMATVRRFHRTILPGIALIPDRCNHDSSVVMHTRSLLKQLLAAGEQAIDTLLARDTCTDADTVYGFFSEIVRDIKRTLPDDTTLTVFTMKMSRGVVNKLANRIGGLLEKEKYASAASHYRGAESFVAEQVALFPDEKDIRFQYGYFEEKKQMVLFVEKDIDAFIRFSRDYLEKIGRDAVDDTVLLQNALYNVFVYIQYCTERKEFEKAERLIDSTSTYLANDPELAQNMQWALGKAFHAHFENGDWEEAIRIGKKQIAVDKNSTYTEVNSGNLQICYQNWATGYYNESDLPKARAVLNACINDTSAWSDECSSRLRKLEKE
ncbi:MAG: hypothetical protein JW863_19605 [Chitinispirillaceae bacterium]|nr:hypothetical protein [Chitinispirillaceae bacterium]